MISIWRLKNENNHSIQTLPDKQESERKIKEQAKGTRGRNLKGKPSVQAF